jgi:uncharacterized FAD-dependent dehydrogenase
VEPGRIKQATTIRRNIDARGKWPNFNLHIHAQLTEGLSVLPHDVIPLPLENPLLPPKNLSSNHEIIVVGTGPAGLFAALRLCQAGCPPLVIDRGADFPTRHQAVKSLQHQGRLNPEANFHFGLGGAGTYSDGKLFTRLRSPLIEYVLQTLQRHGCGSREQILVDAHPHVGTDRWPPTLENLLAELKNLGCRFMFSTRVRRLFMKNGRINGLKIKNGYLACEAAILAPGNSARDLFSSMLNQGISLEAKALAIGLRMTHPQNLIDRIQYGQAAGHPALGPASYRLTSRHKKRAIYSFCMCPGGTVVPTPTEPDHLTINGMSNSARDSQEANAAIVVSVGRADYPDHGPLSAMTLQRKIEQAAYRLGGGDYVAPAQRLLDFIHHRPSRRLPKTQYEPGLNPTDLSSLFPASINDALINGLASFIKNMPDLADPKSVLVGVETRTSSPVRILRGKDGHSPSATGLFPAGEGAGYAGGITSSAADGIKAADKLIAWLEK